MYYVRWYYAKVNSTIENATQKKCGEDELLEICKRKNIPMVIDDIKATKRFKDKIEWLFIYISSIYYTPKV